MVHGIHVPKSEVIILKLNYRLVGIKWQALHIGIIEVSLFILIENLSLSVECLDTSPVASPYLIVSNPVEHYKIGRLNLLHNKASHIL